MRNKLKLDLQLFADEMPGSAVSGAQVGTETAAGSETGVTDAIPARRGRKENPLANVQYGRAAAPQQAAAAETQEAKPERTPFKQLIEGDYKEDFHNHMQGILQERFKKNDQMQRQVDNLMPVLMGLGQRYGVDMSQLNDDSIKALKEKLDADDDHLEKEALEKGMSKEGYKLYLEVQNREKILAEKERRTQAQQDFERHFQQLDAQAKPLGIDLRKEMQNPEFMRLTSPGVGVPVEMAYKLIHQQEILENGMQYAAQQGAQRVAQAVQSGQVRAIENGMARKGGNVIYKQNPRDLTAKDREEIRRRVRAGDESIVF